MNALSCLERKKKKKKKKVYMLRERKMIYIVLLIENLRVYLAMALGFFTVKKLIYVKKFKKIWYGKVKNKNKNCFIIIFYLNNNKK
jgi:hypothetical protein